MPVSSADILAAWEEGIPQPPVIRALLLLSALAPERGDWADVSVGVRDAALLRLRDALFGSRLDTVATCPKCGERVELSFHTHDIDCRADPPDRLRIESGGYEVEFRTPASADLIAVAHAGRDVNGRSALLSRCVFTARAGEIEIPSSDLPEPVVDAVAAAMADADPQADVRVRIVCGCCGHAWPMPFDIVSYLWSEIDDWAHRLLYDVRTLAIAYGWSETEILGMTPRRRRIYLELAGAQ